MLFPGSDAVAVPLGLSEAAPLDCVAPGGGAGGWGPALGVTEFDGAEGELGPWELDAVTVKVYAVPLVSPVTVQIVPLVLQVCPPGELVAV
jgi:hypothetical protein